MGDIRINYDEVLLYLAIWNAVLGLLFGFFPLFIGLRFKNRKYGVFGLAGSIVGGSIAGVVLSFPIAMLFTWLILRCSSHAEDVPVVNDAPAPPRPDDSGDQ